jgi:hypothetical protein
MDGHTFSVSVTPQAPGDDAATATTSGHDHQSGWLTMVEAARYLRLPCPGGRAPTSVYKIAQEIGSSVGGRWLIHADDLNQWIRRHAQGAA